VGDDDLDPQIYSGTSVDPGDGGGFRRLTWREEAERLRAEVRRLSVFARMVNDLDRNEHGRHEGDVDGGDPTGVSQGNPRLHTGDVLGYSIAGDQRPYVMPERGQRHDPQAWGAR
jgi:hypothetical protein